MTITFVTREKFQEFIKDICFSSIEKFTPSKFAKFANISIDDSFKLLIEHVATKELELSWELRCPNCSRVLTLNNDKNFDEYECDFCYETFDVDENDLFPKFQLTEKYKKHLINSKKDGDSGKKFKKTVTNITDKNIPIANININEATWKLIEESDSPITFNFFNGDNNINQNSNSFNNSNFSNSNIQSNHNNQVSIVPEKFIQDLEDDINNVDDEILKEMNEKYLYDLKNSLKENDKENAKKLLTFMTHTLGNLSSITAIVDFLK